MSRQFRRIGTLSQCAPSRPALAICSKLTDWFERCGARTVAMESTGVYWIPAYELLEQRGFGVVLVNARDAKHVPGRTT